MVYLEPITEETQSDLHSQTSGGTSGTSVAGGLPASHISCSSDLTDPHTNLTSALRPSSYSRGRRSQQDENENDDGIGIPDGIRNNGLKRWWHVMGMSGSSARNNSSSHHQQQQSASNANGGSVHSNSEGSSRSSVGSESGHSSTLAIDMGDDGIASHAHGSSLNLLPPLALDGDGDVDVNGDIDGSGLHHRPISSMDNEAGDCDGEAASDGDDGVVSLASLSGGGGSPTRSPARTKRGGAGEGVDLTAIRGADASATGQARKVSFSQHVQVTKISSSSPRRSPGRGAKKHLVYASSAQRHGNGELAYANNNANDEGNVGDKQPKRRCSRSQLLMGFTLLSAFLAIVIGVSVHLINSSGKNGGPSSSGSTNAANDETDDDAFATEAPTLELAAPTSAPTIDPYRGEILAAADALLRSISPDTSTAIDNDANITPQKLAYEWITMWDEANLELDVGQSQQSETRNVVTARRYVQRFVLGVLYFSMGGKGNEAGNDGGATKDPFYDHLSTLSTTSADVKPFLSAHHECRWFGISCKSLPSENANYDKTEEVVVSIDLSDVGLMGTIPDEIGKLEAMEDLSMFDNDIFGTIPSSLMALPKLTYLDLGNNFLTGSIPPLSSQLEFLYLNQNRLSGSVPRGENGVEYKLKHLWAHQCQLTGPLPDRLANYGKLEQLLLYENQLTSTIPTTLTSLSLLSHLDLSSNSLTGGLPDTLYEMPSLSSVYLSSNQLSGPIISQASSSSRQLTYLWLNENSFSGDISPSFGEFLNLRSFLLQQNNLEGTMPVEVCDLFGARGELERLEADCVEGIPVNCTCCTACV